MYIIRFDVIENSKNVNKKLKLQLNLAEFKMTILK